jgi:hypothetical protein
VVAGQSPDKNGVLVDDFLGYVVITQLLLHESGEYIESELRIAVWNPDAQKIGSAQTYGERYMLRAVAGVPGEDDDGNAATGKPNQPQKAPQRRQEPPTPPKAATPAPMPPKAKDKAVEAVTGPDAGPHPGGENTERMERKSDPPAAPPTMPAELRAAIHSAMKALRAARPGVYATAAACEQRVVDATGVASKALTKATGTLLLASLLDECREHGVVAP